MPRHSRSTSMLKRATTMLLLAVLSLAVLPQARAAGPLDNHTLPHGPFTTDNIAALQKRMSKAPVGQRVAFWAESFLGAPYDTDPKGAYVTSRALVYDAEVDCMYLVFRAASLATSDTPEAAAERAKELMFTTRGKVVGGLVTNYDERFEYAEDMVASGKWGKDITATLGKTTRLAGSRSHDHVDVLPKDEAQKPGALKRLQDGDIIYFVKDPARRAVGEIVGHLGVVKVEDGAPMLIHASGNKSTCDKTGGGVVKKVALADYMAKMKFVGVMVTRFGE